MSQTAAPEQHAFKAEVQKLLHIITHSIYTNKEIFLRELISNASDALDKLRFESSRSTAVKDPDLPLEIRLSVDQDKKLLVIEDTGVGMTRDEIVDNLGTIAKSGTEAFLHSMEAAAAEGQAGAEASEKDGGNIIGRFGVGFYAVFMVADKVRVTSRSYREDAEPVVWESDGAGAYNVGSADQDLPRGTRIEAYLKDDAKDFLEKGRLEGVIKKHSNFINFPILLEGEKVNTISALWREPKFQIKPEQYEEFYKFLSYDGKAPLEVIHTAVDAPVQFTALAFVPETSRDVFGMGHRDAYGLDLYVRRVLIQHENKDLLPEYLAFLKGVVDTEDLPLNLSRETLQENVLIRKINTTLTKQVLTHLEKMAKERPEAYETFWRAHHTTFRLGYGDYANREKFAPLLRFNASWHEDAKGLAGLDDYIARAKGEQKEIYYLAGTSREAINLNPHLEIFKAKGVDVLYLYEPMDELVMDTLGQYKDFNLVSAELADMAKLEALPSVAEKKDAPEELDESGKQDFETLLKKMQDILGDRVTEVRASHRLSDSPCCLVSPEGGLSSSMQKIMHIVSKDTSIPQKILEVNREHPLVRNLMRIFKHDAEDELLKNSVEQLYESSLLLEGYLQDPHAMVARINKMLQNSSGWYAEIKKL